MQPKPPSVDALFAEFSKSSAKLQASWNVAAATIQKALAAQNVELGKLFDGMRESFARLQIDIEGVSKSLAARGWYFDPELPITALRPVLTCFVEGRETEVDDFLVKHFSSRLDVLQAELLAAYPKRSEVLSHAFSAHRVGHYHLSIPVFLAQADGICAEVFGGKLFQKKRRIPQVAIQIERLQIDDFSGAFLSVLGLPGGMCANEEFRDKYPDCLNRHEILHGIDVNYGTALNGWKSLSLLGFVGLFAKSLARQNA